MVNKFVNKLMKKFKFLTKKGNMNKVLFLALVLLALYMLHRFALGGFEGLNLHQTPSKKIFPEKVRSLFYSTQNGAHIARLLLAKVTNLGYKQKTNLTPMSQRNLSELK